MGRRDWTDEQIEAVAAQRKLGRSSAEIAVILGKSRNAVLGLEHRMREASPISNAWTHTQLTLLAEGVAAGETPAEVARATGRTRSSVLAMARRSGTPFKRRVEVDTPPERIQASRVKKATRFHRAPRPSPVAWDETVFTCSEGKTLMDRKWNECHFPLWKEWPGIERAFYCGEPTEGKTYCPEHGRVMWIPARKPGTEKSA